MLLRCIPPIQLLLCICFTSRPTGDPQMRRSTSLDMRSGYNPTYTWDRHKSKSSQPQSNYPAQATTNQVCDTRVIPQTAFPVLITNIYTVRIEIFHMNMLTFFYCVRSCMVLSIMYPVCLYQQIPFVLQYSWLLSYLTRTRLHEISDKTEIYVQTFTHLIMSRSIHINRIFTVI